MGRTYHYKGYTLEVTVESNSSQPRQIARTPAPAYVAVVTVQRTGIPVAIFSPLRLGNEAGRAFLTEGDALLSGYGAARRIVDDLLAIDAH
jgi:hypothetical protein